MEILSIELAHAENSREVIYKMQRHSPWNADMHITHMRASTSGGEPPLRTRTCTELTRCIIQMVETLPFELAHAHNSHEGFYKWWRTSPLNSHMHRTHTMYSTSGGDTPLGTCTSTQLTRGILQVVETLSFELAHAQNSHEVFYKWWRHSPSNTHMQRTHMRYSTSGGDTFL